MKHLNRQAGMVRGQRGAAALIVVMILFFVVSMVAAYTNRNLIFEQKTSANNIRSTRAIEAAEAGLQWAVKMLNSGRLTAACETSASLADNTFRQRYLAPDPLDNTNGKLIPRKRSDGVTDLYPSCVYDGAAWTCDCPANAAPTLAAPATTGILPAFRVRFRRVCGAVDTLDSACVTPTMAGIINVDVNACSTLDENCLTFTNPSTPAGEARATVHAALVLRGSIPTAPNAALTALGNVAVSSDLSVTNSEPNSQGITVQAGGTVTATSPLIKLFGKPGSPGSATVRDTDLALSTLSADRMFANTFGMWRQTFIDQPGAVRVNCGGTCTSSTVLGKLSLNPGRPLVLNGDLSIDSTTDIGSATEPVLLYVTGSVSFSSTATVYGLIYSAAPTWSASGAGSVIGAAVAEGSVVGSPTTSIVRDRTVLARVRSQIGSFAVGPGTWRDLDQ